MKAWRLLAALALAGCVSQRAGYDDVRALVKERSGADVRWRAVDDGDVTEGTAELLAKPLTPRTAVAVALLNDHELQAAFEELGVAGADLQRALALPNPHVKTGVHFLPGRDAQFDIEVMLSLSHFLFMPLREQAASAELEATVLEVSGKVLDRVLEVRRAFYEQQAAAQILKLRRTALAASRAAVEAAEQLREAGNITALEAATQVALYEEARLAVGRAEVQAALGRERLGEVMGLWGKGMRWKVAGDVAALPESEETATPALERQALGRSIDLRIALRRHEAAAYRADLANGEGWLPDVSAGVEIEREEEGWEVGPELELEVPLFYQGQGEVRAAESDMRRQKALHAAMAVRVRAAARAAGARLAGARAQAQFYRDVLLPLRDTIVKETVLQSNAMAASVFDVLEAKRMQLESQRAYIESLRDYWLARADVEQLLAGRLVRRDAMPSEPAAAPAEAGGGGH